GYTFTVQTFDESEGTQVNTYTIWNGESSVGPQIGMEKEEETGFYYWTLDGEPMLDAAGEKVYTSKAPKLRINNSNKWEISYDEGATWIELGVFTGTISSTSIQVEVKDGNVVIKQEGKDDITIPVVEANSIKIKFTNIDATAGMRVLKSGVYLVEYELENASANATVKAEMLNGTNFIVENLPGQNKFKITGKGQNMNDVVLIHVYDGNVCMHTSFNITPDASITAVTITNPEVNLPLYYGASDDYVYTGELRLEQPATEDITFSVIPVGTDAVTSQNVTIPSGTKRGTYEVRIKRNALTAGNSYIFPLVFSGGNTSYHVSGETRINVSDTPVKIKLTSDMLESKYTHTAVDDGGIIGALCDDNLENFWGSNWTVNCPAADPTYGVYIDITLPQALCVVRFRYYTRFNNENAVPTAIAVGVSSNTAWTTLFTVTSGLPSTRAVWWNGDVLHSLSDHSSFTKIRFGVTASAAGNLITDPSKSTALTELEVYGLY
ncbi:MAG: DUF4988 domain-containing protein, partial [Odoribacter sp.]|nr:DUF4988 domain-containing protein [Odoribacter sp.]